MNVHVLNIVIIWPDDKWSQTDEEAFIASALRGVKEHLEQKPLTLNDRERLLANALGRVYAKIDLCLTNPVGG